MAQDDQVALMRRICRFEAVRSAMLSIGSDLLDENTPSIVFTVSLDDECGAMGLSYVVQSVQGVAVYGGDL